MARSASTTTLLVRVIVAFALTFALGFERELRGSPAGDRTFSLIGTASAVLGNLAGAGSPNAIAGAVTGIGFIGGGIVFRRTVRPTADGAQVNRAAFGPIGLLVSAVGRIRRLRLHWSDQGLDEPEDLMRSTVTGLPGAVGTPGRAGNASGWAPLQMLDGTDGPARLVFESGNGRRHTARLDRWIAIIRLQRSAARAARVIWLLDARTVRWSGGLPPGDFYRGVTGLNAEETPILWFRAGDGDYGRRAFTASGVFGAAGIMDAARVRVAGCRMRRQVRLRMAVNPQMWGLSACLAAPADTCAEPGPELTITAAGTLRPLESEAIRTWM